MRTIIYARYSSDLQREASIEDQIRLCRKRIEEEGWQYLHAYTDRAQSGASALRPAYQNLLEDARRGEFDVVVAEALDRLSRDQEDVAGLFKRLRFAGVRLFTLAEGEISELHVGLKGTMNALFLKDLAAKTRRGLEGRVRMGKSGGGLCFGYSVVIEHDARGDSVHGGRAINETEAAIVRRVFAEFAAGRSPRAIAHALTHDNIGVRSERARRPVYLLSSLLRCGACGGGFSKVSQHHYGCSNARNRGTCDNLLTIRRDVLEASVLSGLKTHLMTPDLAREFAAEYHRELNRLNAAREGDFIQCKEELDRVERQIRAVIDAIKDGLRTPGMKNELIALEASKQELAASVKQAPPPSPRLHPKLADLYRQRVERLHEELNRQELRSESAQALRGLMDEVRLIPENGRLEIELHGDLAGILALGVDDKKPATADRDGLQVTLVAGIGFEPMTFRL